MNRNSPEIVVLSVRELLDGRDTYVIPVYQRNYAWEEAEITQLIQDIIDSVDRKGNCESAYYLGTLVVYEAKVGELVRYETIDGQQRFTTLFLLACAIRHQYREIDLTWLKGINLTFECRKVASESLRLIYREGEPTGEDLNQNILHGYELARDILKVKLQEDEHVLSIERFSTFLFDQVKILRVAVPPDTDHNHYFEIMNNRGEQLEKHEILKARFLREFDVLDSREKKLCSHVFHLIWDACSNMEKYVQYGFSTGTNGTRDALFGKGSWNDFDITDFTEILERLDPILSFDEGNVNVSLIEIIDGKERKAYLKKEEDTPDRFNAVVSFPNFLLHVLRVQTRHNIPLDDKQLLPAFEVELERSTDTLGFTQEFAYHLLKARFLFDQYIIKREFISGEDRWSLKRLKVSNTGANYVDTFSRERDSDTAENKNIIMLLAMFHVSNPAAVYKHWLNAAMLYLVNQPDAVNPAAYINYLESLAKAFVFDRFLSRNPKEYYDMIYGDDTGVRREKDDLNLAKLVYGHIVNNLVFNYCDYLLWKTRSNTQWIRNFEFTFRSSVEHYYPRHPMRGYPKLAEDALHCFGNLCLISHSENSTLNHQPPIAKRSYYEKGNMTSIKQYVMVTDYDPDKWNEASIFKHNADMIELFMENRQPVVPLKVEPVGRRENGAGKALVWYNKYKSEDKGLLARALLCFDAIQTGEGGTNYGRRYSFYQWDEIIRGKAYSDYKAYILANNPVNLREVINRNLKENQALRADTFRYLLVARPELLQYCRDGYIAIDDGGRVILMAGLKATDRNVAEMYTYLLAKYIEEKCKKGFGTLLEDFGFAFSLTYDPALEAITLDDIYEVDANVKLEIWRDDNDIKITLSTYHLKEGSKFAERLRELGWKVMVDKKHVWRNNNRLFALDENHVQNYETGTLKLLHLLKNGLQIVDIE